MNVSQADGASKYLFPRVQQEQHIHKCYKETEKQKQTRPGPAKMSQRLLSLSSVPWPHVLGRLSALKLPATGQDLEFAGPEIAPVPLGNFPSQRWV